MHKRTQYLESKGCKILRFWNRDVTRDIEAAIRAIIQAMDAEQRSQKT